MARDRTQELAPGFTQAGALTLPFRGCGDRPVLGVKKQRSRARGRPGNGRGRLLHFGKPVGWRDRNHEVLDLLEVVEEQHTGGKTVKEVLAADGADLAHRKETGHWYRAHDFVNQAHIVVGLAKKTGAPTVASEEQGTGRACRMP